MRVNPEQLAATVVLKMRHALAPLVARVAALEGKAALVPRDGRDGAQGPRGDPGEPGKSYNDDDLRAAVKAAVVEAVTPLHAKILALEAREPIPGPAGPQGPQGERGADGANGTHGLDGVNGKDGAPGLDGQKGVDGLNGKDGAHGRDGLDGVNGKDGTVGRDGRDGVKGEPGLDGRDGIDGFGLEDFALEYDGERNLTFVFERGNLRRAKTIELSHVLYRDVYAEGQTYARGDAVTWGGSVWVANETTTDKPGTSKAWKLAVKRGRDGRDGKAAPKSDRA